MPEGHVLHRLARELTAAFVGHPLTVTSPQGRFAAEAALIDAATLTHATAVGKHLFLEFGDVPGPANIVHIHLGLIGSLTIAPLAEPHGQVRLRLATTDLATNLAADLRGPQWCRLITPPEQAEVIARQGADPLVPGARPDFARLGRSRRAIGALLMDQSLIAGVGNVYRAEVLFRQRVFPYTPARELPEATLRALWDDLVALMAVGVARGRIDTVAPEHEPEAMGRPPRRDDHGGEVYVYRRAGAPCHVCGTPISTAVMESRNLFWCPTCQGEDDPERDHR